MLCTFSLSFEIKIVTKRRKEMSIQLFFFPFLFSDYFCSVNAYVIRIVSGDCNQSFCSFWCILQVFVLLHWCYLQCWYFLTHIVGQHHLWDVRPMHCQEFSCSLSICLSSSLVHFKNGPQYLTKGQVFTLLMRFLQYSLVSSSFHILLWYSF